MKNQLLILTLFLLSCRSVHLSARKEQDLNLSENVHSISTTFNNNIIDSLSYTPASIWQRLSNKNYKEEYLLGTKVRFTLTDKNHIKAELLSDGKLLETKILKGRFKKGYFAIRNRWKAQFTAGPLLWAFAGFKIYLGVTRENNLVLLETNAGSTVIVILPLFWAGSTNSTEYKLSM